MLTKIHSKFRGYGLGRWGFTAMAVVAACQSQWLITLGCAAVSGASWMLAWRRTSTPSTPQDGR